MQSLAGLPANLASCHTSYQGSRGAIYVIAADVNHSTSAEMAVWEVLEHLHRLTPLCQVAVTLDSSYRGGPDEYDNGKSSLRRNPVEDLDETAIFVRTEVASFFVNAAALHGARGFSYASQPACDATTVDDWYYWALSADSADLLNQDAARILLADAILRDGTSEADQQRAERLSSLLRLEWDAARWLQETRENSDDLQSLLPSSPGGHQQVMGSLKEWLALAVSYYRANLSRVKHVCDELSRWPAVRGPSPIAVVIGLPWISFAHDQLKRLDVSHILVVPAQVQANAAIDDVDALLGQADRKLQDIARRVFREPIHYALNRMNLERQERAERWYIAGGKLAMALRLDRAEECVERARTIDPLCAAAWFQSAYVAVMRRQLDRARRFAEHGAKLDPAHTKGLALLCEILVKQGQHQAGLRIGRRAIYLDPSDGELWYALGLQYRRAKRNRSADHCFARAISLGMTDVQTAQIRSRRRPLLGPVSLSRMVVWLKHVWFQATLDRHS